MTGIETPEISVVVPVFNEAGNAAPLCAEIDAVLSAAGRSFEIIFVNDGSTDDTVGELRRLQTTVQRLRILDLDGNFGEASALSAGFQAARGNLVISLDGDGQNDPRDIPLLLTTLETRRLRVVSGWRQQRREGYWLRVLPSRVANAMIAAVTGLPLHDNGCGLKVYRREVVERAQLPRGFNRFIPAVFGVRAGEVAEVEVNDRRRRHGESHYGFSRTLIVLRDLLALRLITRAPVTGEWAMGLLAAAAIAALASATGPLTQAAILVVALAGATNWWNLHRYNRAQREGVFRIKAEYTAEETRPGGAPVEVEHP